MVAMMMMMTISTVSAVDGRLQSMAAVDDLEKMVMSRGQACGTSALLGDASLW